MAGRVNPPRTTKAKARPRIERNPRHAATSTMAAMKRIAQTIVAVPRWKSKKVYRLPSGPGTVESRIASPTWSVG